MNITLLILIILALILIVLLLTKNKKNENIVEGDIVHNPNEKVTLNQLEKYFDENTLKLFKKLAVELSKLEKTDFLWRGPENGWVFTIKGSEGNYGSIVLNKSKLTCQMVLGRNQLNSIRTDDSISPDFNLEMWLIARDKNIGPNSAFFEMNLNTESDILNFIKLMELNKFYS